MSETNNEKKIFKFFDGFKEVYADPFEIDWGIQKASELEDMNAINRWLNIEHSDDGTIPENVPDDDIKLYKEACHRLLPIIRKAFQIQEFDRETGEGLTGEQVLDVYSRYIDWALGLKKNTG